MGKLVVTEFVSVDGVFELPGGAERYEHGGWTFDYDRGEDGNTFKLDEVMQVEVQTLLAHDVVDELRMMVFPPILGRGKRLFPNGIDRVKLRLADTKTVGTDGVQIHTFVRGA